MFAEIRKRQERNMSFVTENFDLLSGIGKAIAMQFGPDCEVVLHDMTRSYDHTIAAIWNGHVTGRRVGGGGTSAGLEILRGSVSPKDQYHYVNQTKDGKLLRSTSKYFKDQAGNVVGSLCINFDITGLVAAQNTMAHLTAPAEASEGREVFANNVDELLDVLFQEAVSFIGKSPAELNKDDKVEIVKYLDQKGAFLIKKSAERIAQFLGITRYTVYNYINQPVKEEEEELCQDC